MATNNSRRNSTGTSQVVRGKKSRQQSRQYDPKLAMLWKTFGLIAAAPADVREQIIAEYEDTFSQITQTCVSMTLRQSSASGSNQFQVSVPAEMVPLINYLKNSPHAVDQLLAESRQQH